ncbi:MAG: 50S ribosomal protein L9 [Rickettsiaceae bacterium]|nr:MAG: 50S ribosomal protein L9 [Rickettsiaceae bacterium]
MEIILIKPLKKVGKIGSLIKVKDGYARNWLIPQGLALRATTHNKALIEDKKHQLEENNTKAKFEAQALADIVNGQDLIFIKQSAADGRLFGSVNNKDVAKSILATLDQNVPYSCIELEEPLKRLGSFSVTINLHHDVICNINVLIARSESEGQEALRIHKMKSQTPDADILDQDNPDL